MEDCQSISVDNEKIISSANSSLSSNSSNDSSSSESESDDDDIEIRKIEQIPMIVSEESTSKYRDVNLTSNDDSSKQLINSDESNQNEGEEDDDDVNVTTDLTLTKTVEPTEYDPDPEIDHLQPNEEKQTIEAIPEVKVIEEPVKVIINNDNNVDKVIDIKELSHNFESTMDDISDAELESLEQELDDLIAAAAENSERIIEETEEVKSIVQEEEESIEKTVEVSNNNEVEETKVTEVVEEIQEVPMELESEKVPVEEPESISEAQEAIEPETPTENPPPTPQNNDPETDHDAALSTSSTDESASIQNLPSQSNEDFSINESVSTGSLTSQPLLGHVPPHWVPDSSSQQCMQCDQKFTIFKRRHHCRACGLLLCSNCCSFEHYLHYSQSEGRVCERCCEILKSQSLNQQQQSTQPTPANPSSYCSTIPVQQQINANQNQQPPTVMVPTGVLKRTPRNSTTERKSVIFSDGIRPGTDLDDTINPTSSNATPPPQPSSDRPKLNFPKINEKNSSYILDAPNELPPIIVKDCEFKYVDNNLALLQRLRQEELKFAINKNFYVIVKIVTCEFS